MSRREVGGVPAVENVITETEIEETAGAIASVQTAEGLILWFPGGHADPWNHIEAAMALAVAGRVGEAEAAYQWLMDHQLDDGSWHHYYLADGIEDPKFDANVCAYIATGAWHHYQLTRDGGFLETMWPVVEAAIDWVLDLQTSRGEIVWARHADGTPWSFALLTGSSSTYHSLRCAIAVAEHLGHERPDWELSAGLLGHCVAHVPEAFAPKNRWAMDWYYPVLSGALSPGAAAERVDDQWDTFVMEGKGIRCVSDRPWITAAETSECVMALLTIGRRDTALDLYRWVRHLRRDDGFWFTGIVYPELVSFPGNETSSYTAAAAILAADALSRTTRASGVLLGEGLPHGLDPTESIDADELDFD
ncbi:MAG TPA: hypothetical protein VGA13_02785 [Acidimicrobiales bacterium]